MKYILEEKRLGVLSRATGRFNENAQSFEVKRLGDFMSRKY